MTAQDERLLNYESTLNSEARRQLRQIGWADILIGIPSHRNGRTIQEVLDAVSAGVTTYFPDRRVVLMNADGGSSDNTVNLVDEVATPANVTKLLVAYQGQTGKGTAIRSIFEVAAKLKVKACVVFEAQAPGITAEWLPSLIGPVMHGDEATLAYYHRSAYAAALCDNLVYPFVRVFFNTDLRDPVASEFAVSGRLAAELAECDVWETNIARYGVNVWLSTYIITRRLRASQVDLGCRGECASEPGALLDPRIIHSGMALFRLLSSERRRWQGSVPPFHVALKGGQCPDRQMECLDCRTELLAGMREGVVRYADQLIEIIAPERLSEIQALLALPDDDFHFPVQLWVETVLDFALSYTRGEGDPDRVMEALLPVFYGRTASYLREAATLTPVQREQLVRRIVAAFQRARPSFEQAWNESEHWDDVDERFW